MQRETADHHVWQTLLAFMARQVGLTNGLLMDATSCSLLLDSIDELACLHLSTVSATPGQTMADARSLFEFDLEYIEKRGVLLLRISKERN